MNEFIKKTFRKISDRLSKRKSEREKMEEEFKGIPH
jgi:hypothetical protein